MLLLDKGSGEEDGNSANGDRVEDSIKDTEVRTTIAMEAMSATVETPNCYHWHCHHHPCCPFGTMCTGGGLMTLIMLKTMEIVAMQIEMVVAN